MSTMTSSDFHELLGSIKWLRLPEATAARNGSVSRWPSKLKPKALLRIANDPASFSCLPHTTLLHFDVSQFQQLSNIFSTLVCSFQKLKNAFARDGSMCSRLAFRIFSCRLNNLDFECGILRWLYCTCILRRTASVLSPSCTHFP